MPVSNKLSFMCWSVRLLGIRATIRGIIHKMTSRLRAENSYDFWYQLYRRFDERFDVDTTDEVSVAVLDVDDELKPEIVEYMPTSAVVFAATVQVLPMQPADFTFVDFGCGKGRALFLADLLGFQRIVGVELSPTLAEQAWENIHRFRTRTKTRSEIQIVQQNATDFEIPDGPCVLYFFNPFGASLLREVLRQIETSMVHKPRRMIAIYNNAQHPECFDQSSGFRECYSSNDRTWLAYESTVRTA